jgi:8-oxo-dGTP pyrophosphatase MutT (NUDIX family)
MTSVRAVTPRLIPQALAPGTAVAFSHRRRNASFVTMPESLVTALAAALSGRSRVVLPAADRTVAAVLVPLLDVEGAPQLLFTRRSQRLPHHRGQVAFPGGRHHPELDADLRATALREAQEEVGVDPARVRLLGALDDIETVASRFRVTPFVGVVERPYAWRPCPREVDAIFTVPLSVLCAPEAARQELWDFDGHQVPVDTFPVDGHVIWGATQRITQNLLDVLACLR